MSETRNGEPQISCSTVNLQLFYCQRIHGFSFLVSGMDYGPTAQSPLDTAFNTHTIVRNDGNKPRLCFLCKIKNIKTKSGWKAYTRFHCKECEISLCKGERDCFMIYHSMLRNRWRAEAFKVEKSDSELGMYVVEHGNEMNNAVGKQ